MSRIDGYEHQRRRGVFRGRQPKRKAPGAGAKPRDVQLALKLMGGTTAKDKGQPFDDPIPF